MRTCTLTNIERHDIVTMQKKGLKYKDIAHMLQMSRSTVSTVLKKYRLTGSMEIEPSSRPKPQLNTCALQDLARLVCYDRQQTLTLLVGRFYVHKNTIRTYIGKLGFCNRIVR